MTAASLSAAPILRLAAKQNADGGWGYRDGSSWTEPTVFALLAIAGQPELKQRGDHARRWLARCLRPDGGFAPRPEIEESTWVTALVVLAGACPQGAERGAVEWLLGQTNRDSFFVFRLRAWLLGSQRLAGTAPPGWSWYPGTAAWVVPTSLTILALESARRRIQDPRIRERLEQGRGYLLVRRCEDGGWNHGSTSALGFQAVSYPETTGIALTALRGTGGQSLAKSVARAREHFDACRSAEGRGWLRLGLLAQNAGVPAEGTALPERTLMDTAIGILAERAREGRSPLWEGAA